MAQRIQQRRDVAADWTADNPILAAGETGVETDTGKFKIGNGTSTWSALPYFAPTTAFDTSGTSASAVSAHVAASDPHGDRAAATAALSAHTVAADPHPGYTTAAELAAYTYSKAESSSRYATPTLVGNTSRRAMIYDDATAGQSNVATDLATTAYSGTTVYSRKTANTAVLQTSTNGSSISDKYTFTGEVINAIHVMASGAVIVFTSDTNTLVTPSTFVKIYRSTDGGTNFTRVDGSVVTAGGYVLPWGVASTGTTAYAGLYGYKANSTARYVYKSADDGVTWTQVLDIGANSNRHVHAVFIDSQGYVWVTQGDDSTSGSGNVGGRTVWRSTDAGANWTGFTFYDTDGTTRLQFVGITEHSGYIYLGEDNSTTGGRIFRCLSSDPTNTLQTVYDSNAGRRSTITPWGHPIYDMWTEPTNNIIYAYAPGETATNRGAFLISADGLNWSVLFELGANSVNPSAARFSSNTDSSFVFYNGYRMKKKKAAGVQQNASVQSEVLVFNWPGTISTQAEKWSLDAGMLGFSFRVVRITTFARVAGAGGPITVAVKNGATTLSATEAIIADGATTTARYAEATLTKTSMVQRFTAELNDKLVVDVTAGSGGTDLTVCIAIERQLFPLFMK